MLRRLAAGLTLLATCSPAAAAPPRPGEQREVARLAGPFSTGSPEVEAAPLANYGALVVATDRRPASGGLETPGPPQRFRILRLTGDGAVTGAEATVTTEREVADFAVARDPGSRGGIVVTADLDQNLRALAFDVAGVAVGAPIDLGKGHEPALAYDPVGRRLWLAYLQGDPGSTADSEVVTLRALGARGAPAGPPVPVADPDRRASGPDVAVEGGRGMALVAWAGTPIVESVLEREVLVRRVGADGVPAGEVVQVSRARGPASLRAASGGPLGASVADDSSGGSWAVAWSRVVAVRRSERRFGVGTALVGQATEVTAVVEPSAARGSAISASETVATSGSSAIVTYGTEHARIEGLRFLSRTGASPDPFPVSSVPGRITGVDGYSTLVPLGPDRLASVFIAFSATVSKRALWVRLLPTNRRFDAVAPRVRMRVPRAVAPARLSALRASADCSERCRLVQAEVDECTGRCDEVDGLVVRARAAGRQIVLTVRADEDARAEIGRDGLVRLQVLVRDGLGNLRRATARVRVRA